MKKTITKITLGLNLSLLSLFSYAQTPITASGFNPINGDKFIVNATNYASPGGAGNDQIWNLGMPAFTQQAEIKCVTPASINLDQNFPNANIAFDYSSAQYLFKTSNSAFQTIGLSMNGSNIIYNDAEDLIRFPVKLNDNYTDTWSATINYGYAILYRTGKTTVTVDGYGKLLTPDGVFENVYRVNMKQVYTDSLELMGQKQIIKYDNNQYSWYKDGIHYALAQVMDVTANGVNSKAGSYINYHKSGLKELSNSNFEIFPNPAQEEINVKSLYADGSKTIELTDIYGKKVYSNTLEVSSTIDIKEYPSGIYFVSVYSDNNLVSRTKVSIN